MYLYNLLFTNLSAAIALALCLVTGWLCLRMARVRVSDNRRLVLILGFLSVCQGLRIITTQSTVGASILRRLEGFVDLIVATLFLAAVLVFRTFIKEYASARVRLRLAESAAGAASAESPFRHPAHALFRARFRKR